MLNKKQRRKKLGDPFLKKYGMKHSVIYRIFIVPIWILAVITSPLTLLIYWIITGKDTTWLFNDILIDFPTFFKLKLGIDEIRELEDENEY